jgi:hypothetical protein
MTETVTLAHKQIFQPIDESSVILRQNGTFTPHQVYVYDRNAYVRSGNGYVRLRPGETTTKSGAYWKDLSIPGHETLVVHGELRIVPFGHRAAA